MAFSRSATMSTWADEVEEDEAEMQREESLGLPPQSPVHGYPGSPMSPGRPAAYPGEEPGHYGGPPPMMHAGPPLPDRPPFKAYLGNIPYDLDEEVVSHFFRGLEIVDIIITRHRDTGKPKGCFVEFGSQDDLAKALTADGAPMLRRPVRIQVAEPPRRDGFADRRGGGGGGGGFGRRDRDRDYFHHDEERGGGFGGRRGGGFGGGYGGDRDRDRDRDQGWPSRRGPPGGDQPLSPRERPKLVLQPRSQPAEGGSGGAAPAGQPAAPRSNPFGAARPVDTAAKEREMEEREQRRKAEEAEAKKREKEAAAAAPAAEPKPAAPAAAAVKAPPPPPAAAKPAAAATAAVPPPPPAAGAAAPAADAPEGGAGRGRGGPGRGAPAAGRGAAGRGIEGGRGGRGEGRGTGGRGGRGGEHAAERPHSGGRGGRGGGGGGDRAHAPGRGNGRGTGRGGGHQEARTERDTKPHKPDSALRAKGYILDEDEAPKTKIDNPFAALTLADD